MQEDRNELFPVFLKLNQLKVLLVGAGPVGLEKITAVLNNSPRASIRVVAIDILPDIFALAEKYHNIVIEQRPYVETDMNGYDISIVAVNNRNLSETIFQQAKKAGILVNVADTPDLCDFYLGSIVQKGQLKIAISTNGKSPTMAKRLREWLQSILPEELDPLLENLYQFRQKIKGDFEAKVKQLDELTSNFVSKKNNSI
jgi:siroheme synthase-like protein